MSVIAQDCDTLTQLPVQLSAVDFGGVCLSFTLLFSYLAFLPIARLSVEHPG